MKPSPGDDNTFVIKILKKASPQALPPEKDKPKKSAPPPSDGGGPKKERTDLGGIINLYKRMRGGQETPVKENIEWDGKSVEAKDITPDGSCPPNTCPAIE